jgi:acyl carrier protein
MSVSTTVESRVRALIAEVTRQNTETLAQDDDLVEALGIDSLQGLQILAGVEKRLEVRLPDDELIHMRTIGRISDAVERLRSQEAS